VFEVEGHCILMVYLTITKAWREMTPSVDRFKIELYLLAKMAMEKVLGTSKCTHKALHQDVQAGENAHLQFTIFPRKILCHQPLTLGALFEQFNKSGVK